MSTDLLEPPATEVLDAPKLSAVKVYNPIEAGIALMLKKHGDVLVTPPDVSTAKAMAATKANRTEMVKFRTSIEAARKAEKEESLVYGRLVDSEAKRITAIAAPIEKAYDDAITAEETRLENLRLAELEAERVRITGHLERIQAIKDVRETANLCRTSARLQQLIDGMPAHMEKPYEEFQDQALTAFNEVCTVLGQLLEAKLAQEQQAAELARQQEELATQRAEQARVEQEAAAQRAAEKAEADRLAAIRAKIDAMRELRLQAGMAKTSADVSAIQAKLTEPDDSFAELLPEAQELWTSIAGDLADLFDNKLEAETRVAELEAQAAETKRQQEALDAQRQQQVAPAAPAEKTTSVTTFDAYCCPKAVPLGVQVCPECATVSADFQADMGVTAAAVEAEPTLKLGTIAERLAPLSITADGLRTLGFEPAKSVGASKLFFEADFPAIVNAAIAHLGDVLEAHTPA